MYDIIKFQRKKLDENKLTKDDLEIIFHEIDCSNEMLMARGKKLDFSTLGKFKKIYVNPRFRLLHMTWFVIISWDVEMNRLIKLTDGEIVSSIQIPKNWKDRGNERKWVITDVKPSRGFHLQPMIDITFTCEKTGKKTVRTI